MGTSPADRVAPLLDTVATAAAEASAQRAPSRALFEQVAAAGLVQILVPAAYGGEEASALEFVELVETVARVDGSTAWTMMTLNEEMEIAAAYLAPETMEIGRAHV